jgi:hypothetical protein
MTQISAFIIALATETSRACPTACGPLVMGQSARQEERTLIKTEFG